MVRLSNAFTHITAYFYPSPNNLAAQFFFFFLLRCMELGSEFYIPPRTDSLQASTFSANGDVEKLNRKLNAS